MVACFCSDFLKPDMRHIYRQISLLKRVKPMVFTRKRENAEAFPFPDKQVRLVARPRSRWFRRLYCKHVSKAPPQAYAWEVRRLLLDLLCAEARVLHIYFGNIAMYWLPLLQAFPRPTVVSFHGADAFVGMDQPGARACMKGVLEAADLVQTRSWDLAEALMELGCPERKIVLQRTGIPLDKWPLIERQPPPDGAWEILQACRMVPKKGLMTTLEAFAIVRRRFPKARLHLAGDGELLEALRARVTELGLPAEAVEFPGFLSEGPLLELMRRCHLFVHPSETPSDGNREGVPNAMLEAMATGLPVVATRHGGIPEAVTDGVEGFLTEERDVEGLAAAMERILGDPGLMPGMGIAARGSAADRFGSEAQIRCLEDTYLGLMQFPTNPA